MDKIKEFLEKIIEIFGYIKKIKEIAIEHPITTLTLVFLSISYFSAYYYINHYPKHIIQNFFSHLNSQSYQEALNTTSPNFQKLLERNPGQKITANEFAQLYKTTELNTINELSIIDDDWLLSNIFNDTRKYKLEYETVDVFRKNDFLDPLQERNQMWARIYLNSKVKDIISKETPSADDNVRIRRKWKCEFIVKQFPEGWKIQSYHAKEIALIYD